MIIISAMSENRVIGSGHGMPWSVPDEYQQYLNFVSGNTVVMGRKTYEIFGADLPQDTTAIVISRSATIDGIRVVSSLEKALNFADEIGKPVFVAGGGSIYVQAIPLADEMYLSTIKGHFEGDTYFPEFDEQDWEVIDEQDHSDFVFRNFRRI